MKLRIVMGVLASAWVLCAQKTDVALEDPGVLRARFALERVRAMVESGALPRVKQEKAEADLKDAEDESYITRALYGKDLTLDQAAEVVQAAQRRLDRRKAVALERHRLVESGVIALSEMNSALEDVDRVTKEYEWAVSRQKLVAEVARMAAAEEEMIRQFEAGAGAIGGDGKRVERYDGKGFVTPQDFVKVQTAFLQRFARMLPISANGETAVHRAMGFDHTNRMDVAVMPDGAEGAWLRHYLTANRIPYFAFRTAIARQATGAHVHIGPPSTRYAQAKASVTGPGN